MLAAASNLFNELFTANDHKVITKYVTPKVIDTFQMNIDDVVFPLVMKYVYSN